MALAGALPSSAAATECTPIGVPGQFDVFTDSTFGLTSSGGTIEGRVAVGGNAQLQGGVTIGKDPPLAPNRDRTDLMVAGDLTIESSGGSVPKGRVTYGGLLTQRGTLTALAGPDHVQPEVKIADEFATLLKRSEETAKIVPYVTVSGPTNNVLTLSNHMSTLNVFRVTTEQMQNAGQIIVDVDAGSTTVINVLGSAFTSRLYGIQLLGATPDKVLWNFSSATEVQQHSGLDWRGTMLAPKADVSVSNGQFYGQIFADTVTVGGELVHHVPYTGCLAPLPRPPEPQRNISLKSLCTDPATKRHALVLTNNDPTDYEVHWEDTGSGLSDTLPAPAKKDTFFDIPGGDKPHHIVATSGPTTVEATTGINKCGGSIVIGKAVTGEGIPPPGPWAILVEGGSSFSQTVPLLAGAQATLNVPGRFEPGSVPIGQIAGGYDYTITEPAPLGARASVDPTLVTVTNEQPPHEVAVTNQYDAVPPEPPEPGPEPPVPPQPPLPPGPPQPLPGPDLVLAASLGGGADLAVSERISPRISQVGHVVSVTVRVRNLGPLPADGAVVREIPQVDPRRPNQVAQILGVTPTIRATSPCTSTRPLRCGPATLAVGAQAVVRVRARMLRPGAFQSVVVASSLTPDTNTTNNASVSGLVVRRPSRVAVAVHAPAVARVGEPVSYRVVARGTGSDGAVSVRFCHRPPARLLMTSAPGTFRYRGRVCRDVSRLRAGQRAAFTVHAIPASSAGGRTLPLLATATAPEARPASGGDLIAVVAQAFAGTG
jgi:choice-of-anchor A domain-containing protein